MIGGAGNECWEPGRRARDVTGWITRGVAAWQMIDETYTMADAGADSEILLTTRHPKSMRTLAWTRTHNNARVFCFQSGHDNQTWQNRAFREVLSRGIHWTARRI